MPLISPMMPVPLRVAECCIQIAAESDKMGISHVIKTDHLRSHPQIRPAPHFVVSRYRVEFGGSTSNDTDVGYYRSQKDLMDTGSPAPL